jgi:acetoacetyl-CoA synthetase
VAENPIIWQPDPEGLKKTAMYRFMKERSFDNYDDFYQWSIDDISGFWGALCDFCEVKFSKRADEVLVQRRDCLPGRKRRQA